MKFRAKLRLVERPDGSIGAEIVTPERLGPEVVEGRGVLDPAVYLEGRRVTLTNVIHEELRRGFPAIVVQVPRNGRSVRVVERPLDLSAAGEERALTERLVDQEDVEVRWVNEGVTVRVPFHEGLRQWWRTTLDETAGMSREEWLALLVSFRHDFSEWPGGVRPPRGPRRHVVPPPLMPVPFFAKRAGAIPRTGRPSLAGVRLPKGRRHPLFAPAYWVSDERIRGHVELAAEIAQAFSKTGVWPLLWLYDEDPEAYMQQPGDVEPIDAVDVEALLRRRWEYLNSTYQGNESIFGPTPPRLAGGSPPVPEETARPFQRLPRDAQARLLLVPCNRPADAIAVIGGLDSDMTGPEISAVLRSWEGRFSAIPVAAEPRQAWLAVESPPLNPDQAAMLAGEFNVVCQLPPESHTETLADVAAAMTTQPLRAPTFHTGLQPHLWPIGWYD